MAQGSPVCIPSASPDSSCHQETPIRGGGINLAGPTLAKASLVCRSRGPIDFPTLEDSSGSHLPQSGSAPTPGPAVASTSRLALERESLTRQSYSTGVIAIIQASRRPSTNRIYDATWKSFCAWCNTRKVNPLATTIPILLDYLLDGLNRGLSHNTIRRQIAALSTVLICEDQVQLSHHPAVTAFLKGAVKTGPPVVHRYPTWDLPKVLKVLTGSPFEPIRSCSLHFLSLKVAFLIAVTSARRISELAALSIREDLCIFLDDRVVLKLDPSFIPKVNTGFHRSQDLILPDFCPRPSHRLERLWHTLDVRRALHHYVKRTAAFRRSEALFVSFQPSSMGLKVSSSTIGRWIRACISHAYRTQSLPVPSHITAHSTRSAATSAAWSTQASIEEICRAATWASPSTFIRHYKLDKFAASDASFGRRVLQQVVSTLEPQA